MAKTNKKLASSDLSYDDMVKVLKGIKSNTYTYIGQKEIDETFTCNKIKTGIPTLDFLTSGGLSEGRLTIFAGNVSSSKTTMSLHSVSAVQKHFKENGITKMCLWYDVEGAYDADRAKELGVDPDFIIIKRTKVIEDAFAEIDDLVSTGFIGMLVIDSLDAMVARKVDDSEYGNTMGGAAGAVAMHLPKLFNKLMEMNVTSIFIKQARVKLAMGAPGEILTFSGGKALRHFCDSIFMVNRLSNRNLTYTPIKINAVKTRSSRMGLTLEYPLGDNGVDKVRDMVNLAIAHGRIEQAGAWLTFNGEKYQGLDRLLAYINSNEKAKKAIELDVYNNIIKTNTLEIESIDDVLVVEDVD